MSWTLIDSDQALAELLGQYAGCRVVAMDTEFMRTNTFFPRVALVQLCFDERAWLVDPLAINDTGPLSRLLGDSGVTKVFHSVSEDLEVFDRWLGVLPEPLFDTQRAAALLGYDFGLGYSALVKSLCGEELPKGETRSDWLQRPLSEAQCEYAAQDVLWLLQLWQQLDARAREQGRLDWVLQEGSDSLENFRNALVHPVQRIKSAWKLDRRQLALLMRICEWREAEARQRDKPRGWIIDDAACLAVAQRQPASVDALRAVPELHSSARQRYGENLLSLVGEVADLPAGVLPERLPGPLDPPQRKRLKVLKQRGQQLARALGVDAAAALAGRDYEALLREAEGAAVPQPPHWRGWRAGTLIEPLRQALKEGSS